MKYSNFDSIYLKKSFKTLLIVNENFLPNTRNYKSARAACFNYAESQKTTKPLESRRKNKDNFLY